LKLAALPVLLALATACAHAPVGQGALGLETVQVGGALFEVRHDPIDVAAARQVKRVLAKALPVAERWGVLSAPVVITIHPTHRALEQAAHREGHPWLRAWARPRSVELQSPRTWSRGEATDAELTQILTHELTHCVMYQAVAGSQLAQDVPLWFREGMASVTAGDHHPRMGAEILAGMHGGPGSSPRVNPLSQAALIYKTHPVLVYGTADRAFRWLVARHGEERVRGILRHVREGEPFPAAFQEAIGIPMDAFEAEFRNQVVLEETRG
jgi:hypothetical protein